MGRRTMKPILTLLTALLLSPLAPLHAAETFNPDPEQRKSVKSRPVPVPAKLDSAEKPITASRRDRFANLMASIVGQNPA